MRRKSWNIFPLLMVYLLLLLSVSGCQTFENIFSKDGKEGETTRDGTEKTAENRPLVDEKYSLTADRAELEELRKNIPEEKRKENDELALLTGLFADETVPPSKIRDKFDTLLRKKRDLFQKDMTKKREVYTKDEQKRRAAFTKLQEKARGDFKNRKVTAAERTEFYNDLESQRRDYYAEERSKRDDFEESMRDQRKNFDDYAREKSSEFSQELRAYTRKYDEFQKAQEKKP